MRFTDHPTLPEVLSAACHVARVRVTDVMGRGKHPDVVAARRLYAYCARRHTIASWPEIARAMGGRSHTTVLENERHFARFLDCGHEGANRALVAAEIVIQQLIDQRRGCAKEIPCTRPTTPPVRIPPVRSPAPTPIPPAAIAASAASTASTPRLTATRKAGSPSA